MPDLSMAWLLGIGAAIAAFWRSARTIGDKIMGLMFQRAELDPTLYSRTVGYLARSWGIWDNRTRGYKARWYLMDRTSGTSAAESMCYHPVTFYSRRGLILATPKAPNLNNRVQVNNLDPGTNPQGDIDGPVSAGTIYVLRWFGNSVEKILEEALYASVDALSSMAWSSSQVVTIRGNGSQLPLAVRYSNLTFTGRDVAGGMGTCLATEWTVGNRKVVADRKQGVSALPPVTKGWIDELIAEAKWWYGKSEWYSKSGVPWRRGWFLHGPPGCLHPKTRVFDPVDGTTDTVEDRYRSGKPFHVLSLTSAGEVVIGRADAPYQYPRAAMRKVTLADGRSFTVTPYHRVRVGDDWLTVETVAERLRGCLPVLLRTTGESYPSVSLGDVQHSMGRVEDFQSRYAVCHHPCGEQLRSVEETDRDAVPSQGDARQHNRVWCGTGGQGVEDKRTLLQSFFHQTSKGCTALVVLLIGALSRFRLLSGLFEAEFYSFLKRQQFVTGEAQSHTVQPLVADVQGATSASTIFQDNQAGREVLGRVHDDSAREHFESVFSACTGGAVQQLSDTRQQKEFLPRTVSGWYVYDTPVISVEEMESEVYYDFHVPEHENYWACGSFHHNTGKTRVATSVAAELEIRLVILQLGTMTDTAFDMAWRDHVCGQPTVVLIEEIDQVFKGRENIAMPLLSPSSALMMQGHSGGEGYAGAADFSSPSANRGVRFETLLQALDGASNDAQGTFVIMTANHPEKVDPALGGWFGIEKPTEKGLSSRPGRIDRIVEFGDVSIEAKQEIMKRCLTRPQDITEVTARLSEPMTIAAWQELVVSTAMRDLHQALKEPPTD